MKKTLNIAIFAILLTLTSCGGGSSSSGILIEGVLTQGESAGHATSEAKIRHAAGEKIEHVEICGLGECSTTDSEGQFGFLTPKTFIGGELLITVNGHGINTSFTADIPLGSNEVLLQLVRAENNVSIDHMTVDGIEVEAHHHSESEEEHEH